MSDFTQVALDAMTVSMEQERQRRIDAIPLSRIDAIPLSVRVHAAYAYAQQHWQTSEWVTRVSLRFVRPMRIHWKNRPSSS